MDRRQTKNKGFTLIEIILVIVIIGILAAIIVPKFAGTTDKAKIATTKANLGSLRSAVRLFQTNNDGTPPAALAADLVPTYIKQIPEEAVTPSNAVVGAVNGAGGWAYDPATGEVEVNLLGNDANGDPYSGY